MSHAEDDGVVYEQENSVLSEEYMDTFILFSDIDSIAAKEICEWILLNNRNKDFNRLSLYINSRGGSLSDSFAIIDLIRSSNIPVDTYATGFIGSGGLLIFLAGEHRVLTPRTTVMSHELAATVDGCWGTVKNESKQMEDMYNAMVEHYRECTKLPTSKIVKNLLPSFKDVYLNAEEAFKYKICTKVSYFDLK